MLETVDLDDKFGHLFIADIEFDFKNSTPKQLMYNKIYLPIAEKNPDATERSVFQLIE